MTQAPGDPNVTASLKVLFSPRCCSTCTLTTYQLLKAESSYTQMTLCLATQAQYFSKLECSLSSDMARMSHYCQKWRLKPSAAKTVASASHLHNVRAHRKLQVCLDGQRLMHYPYPKYLGVTLDRTLSLREHLVKTAGKLKNSNNFSD